MKPSSRFKTLPAKDTRRILLSLALASLCFGTASRLAADTDVLRRYQQTNLVSDVPGLAAVTDPNLVNAWGLSRSTTSPWWVADNGTGLSTLYDGAGNIQSLVVTIPNVPGVTDPSAPTGTVFNGSATDFLVAPGKPAHFLFDTEEGTISAWNSGTAAVLMVNNSATAVYKGLTLATNGTANLLYAANFKARKVDVFDGTFTPVNLGPDAFRDRRLPRDFGPFGIQVIGSSIYVAFAQTQPGSIDEVHGPGRGAVDVFSTAGKLQKRLEWGPWFNAPWGLALAPAGFGIASNRILVGQFGSGKIATFDATSGRFTGLLRGAKGRPLVIEGLWALSFGNGAKAGPATTLFFSAGPDDEAHGLFGTLTPMPDGDNDADDGN
ncbi:MAG TPA: TIGR03118 family protein [Opitutaceae bacterium]|nr:TIGR03118 family protein [Opitutaceae bacterium]